MASETDVKVLDAFETTGKKSGKPHMKLELSDGSKILEFDRARFDFFREAKANQRFVRIGLYKSDKGYVSVDSAEYAPQPGDPPAKHFVGAGGAPAGTPGTPENPGPRAASTAGGNGTSAAPLNVHQDAYLSRAFCVLAAGMLGWGGRLVQSEDQFWTMVGKMRHFIETDDIPGVKRAAAPAPAHTGMAAPGAGADDRLPNYDEDL